MLFFFLSFLLGAFMLDREIFSQAQIMSTTYHNVTTNSQVNCQLSDIYEMDFYFVNANTTMPINTFILNPGDVYQYGILMDYDMTYNMMYTLTCVLCDNQTAQSPKVVFLVGANGPNDTTINCVGYYGAKGTYEIIPGIGESYQCLFPLTQKNI